MRRMWMSAAAAMAAAVCMIGCSKAAPPPPPPPPPPEPGPPVPDPFPPTDRTNFIAGVITNWDGKPLGGVEVWAYPTDNPQQPVMLTTDPQGRFLFESLSEVPHDVIGIYGRDSCMLHDLRLGMAVEIPLFTRGTVTIEVVDAAGARTAAEVRVEHALEYEGKVPPLAEAMHHINTGPVAEPDGTYAFEFGFPWEYTFRALAADGAEGSLTILWLPDRLSERHVLKLGEDNRVERSEAVYDAEG